MDGVISWEQDLDGGWFLQVETLHEMHAFLISDDGESCERFAFPNDPMNTKTFDYRYQIYEEVCGEFDTRMERRTRR